MTNIIIGAAAGLVWGVLAGLVGASIIKKALERNDNRALLAANLSRTVSDVLSLAVVFLLRNVLPFSFEAAMIGTAIGLSITTIVTSYKIGASEKSSVPKEKDAQVAAPEDDESGDGK